MGGLGDLPKGAGGSGGGGFGDLLGGVLGGSRQGGGTSTDGLHELDGVRTDSQSG